MGLNNAPPAEARGTVAQIIHGMDGVESVEYKDGVNIINHGSLRRSLDQVEVTFREDAKAVHLARVMVRVENTTGWVQNQAMTLYDGRGRITFSRRWWR